MQCSEAERGGEGGGGTSQSHTPTVNQHTDKDKSDSHAIDSALPTARPTH